MDSFGGYFLEEDWVVYRNGKIFKHLPSGREVIYDPLFVLKVLLKQKVAVSKKVIGYDLQKTKGDSHIIQVSFENGENIQINWTLKSQPWHIEEHF